MILSKFRKEEEGRGKKRDMEKRGRKRSKDLKGKEEEEFGGILRR